MHPHAQPASAKSAEHEKSVIKLVDVSLHFQMSAPCLWRRWIFNIKYLKNIK
jgi:hypothetical protein